MRADLGRIVAQTMTKPAGDRTIEAITGEILDAKRAGGGPTKPLPKGWRRPCAPWPRLLGGARNDGAGYRTAE